MEEPDLGTRCDKINDLKVPRYRGNKFQPALFDRYQRIIGTEDLAVFICPKGVSTRKIVEILEERFHNKYSRSSISRITDITVSEISKWISRSLEKRYIVIFTDAMLFSHCRELVQKERAIFATGIRESGYPSSDQEKRPLICSMRSGVNDPRNTRSQFTI